MPRTSSAKSQRGLIRRRGDSFQVVVYAGPDPLTGKEVRLRQTVHSQREAEKTRTRLLAQVDRQRNAATNATLGFILDSWLAVHDADERTLTDYRGFVERTIKPALGDIPVSRLNARTLEQFYGELRRCRQRCDGTPRIEHTTTESHECGGVIHRRKRDHDCTAVKCRVLACGPHVCRPLGASAIRQVHFIISGALSTAVRWDLIPSNPAAPAKKPRQPSPKPRPPSAAEAARIVEAAWEADEDWGMLVWLAVVTGVRRGELCALRWSDVDLDEGVLDVRRAYSQYRGSKREKDTKTHQIRRIALDPDTVGLLTEHRARYEALMAKLDRAPSPEAYVFSATPDHSKPRNPDAVTHRYAAMCECLGIKTHVHAMRHYSATELIAAGVDLRTIAGRLGHGGGGTTTLRVYAAWLSESDKRAANAISSRLSRPKSSGS